MKKRTFKTLLMAMLIILCSVFAMNSGQESNVMAAENLFEMTTGGSIRIAEPYGLRFQVKMDVNVAKNADKVGMLIFPADYLVNSGIYGDVYYESVEAIPSSRTINLDLTKKLYEKDGYWYGNGAIVNIKENNMSREFAGIAYYEMDGRTVWADTSKITNTTRSAAQVSLLTHADKTYTYSTDATTLLLNYIDCLKAADVEEGAPTRFQVRGYAADNGLRFYVEQYVNNVVETGEKLTDQTHLEAEISQEKIGGGENGNYYKFWLDDTYECDDSSNVENVINEVTVTDRGESFEGYRYKVSYEIFIEFADNSVSTDEPCAYVQFKHHLPGEAEDGLRYAYKEYKDEERYLWQDNCNSYELSSRGIVAKDIRYLETTEEYNKDLFYQNQGTIQAADPCVITIGDTFYLYATNASDGLDCSYIRVWSSKNLTDWIEVGKAFVPAADSWAVSNLWAPEVIAANGKYYMYYSGYNRETEQMGIGVAVSDSPTGPFHEEQPIDLGFPAIDPNPFIDDDGSVYLYVAQDQVNNVSSVYGCKLSSDMVTVESVSEEALVAPLNSENASEDNRFWNEAPYMYKYDGKYYMIFSSGYYQNTSYCLGIATSDDPLSGFSRVNYNPILKVEDSWTHVSGTGHGSFFQSTDGTELWAAYHSHVDTANGGSERKVNFDKVKFDSEGRLVISGPSVTPQVLPSGVSDYGNIASEASVTATSGGNTSLLTDGIVNYRTGKINTYEYSSTGTNTITFTFEEVHKIKGIMVYDSADLTAGGSEVAVTVGGIEHKMTLDSSNIPGTATILEIDETEASVVTLTFSGNINLSEIAVLAEKHQSFDLTTNYFSETSKGVYTLTMNSAGDGGVDDVKHFGEVVREAYYSIKGRITLDTNADWTQARILVSSDLNNEHIIAMERVDGTNYQIFAMSKNNEQLWNDWRLISHYALNGTQNSIDFEVIVNGRQIYFLINDEVCYTSNRVSMTESTVKFSCAINNQVEGASATTTVENLDGQIFDKEQDVKEYLKTKNEKVYESPFQAQIDARYKEYFEDHDCAGKGGTLLLGHSHMDSAFWNEWESQTGLANYVNGYNVGIGGTITMDWLYAYDKLVKPFNADRFVISLGENDINVWGADGAEIVERLAKLFYKIHSDHPEAEIYYIYSLPAQTKYVDGIWLNSKYAELVKGEKELVDSLKYVEGISMFDLLVDANTKNVKTELYRPNNDIHLNADGYKVWSDRLYDIIFKGENFGVTVGDGVVYKTTNGIELKNDKGENPTINMFGGSPRYAYLNDTYSDKLYFETKINVKEVLNNDGYPKFGVILNGKTENLKFYVDMTAEMTATQVGVVHQPTGGDDDWANAVSANVDNMKFTNEDKIKLAVVRDGKAYYFYVNDVLVLTEENAFTDEKNAVGIFSFNTVLTASDYKMNKGENFGLTVGDGVVYKTTDGIELKNDNGANPIIDVMKGGPRYAYLNDTYSDKLYFETKINVKEVLNNDQWPKFGIILNGKTENLKFYVDMTAEMTATQVGVVHQPTGGDDDWANAVSANVDNMRFTNGDKIKLAVARDGKAYSFYVNDELVLVEENAFTDEKSAVGIFSFNTVLTASDYKMNKGENFGVTVGDGVVYKTTNGVELSLDKGEAPEVSMFGSCQRYAYLNDTYEEQFYFETRVNVGEVLENDAAPKFGFVVSNEKEIIKFYLDMTSDKIANVVGVVHHTEAQSNDWSQAKLKTLPEELDFGENSIVKISLLREGESYFFYVNDQLIIAGDGLMTRNSAVGFFTSSVALKLDNYSFVKAINECEQRLEEARKEIVQINSTNATLGTLELGATVWSGRGYVFTDMPSGLLGKPYVLGEINTAIEVTMLQDGYVYVLTPPTTHNNFPSNLKQEDSGFSQLDISTDWCMANYSNPIDTLIFEKKVSAEEIVSVSKGWGILLISEKKLNLNSMLQVNDNATLSEVQIGANIWSDQDYTFISMPEQMIGQEYVFGGINDGVDVTVQKDGYVYVITPPRTNANFAEDVDKHGFERVDVPQWTYADYKSKLHTWVYERKVSSGEQLVLGDWWGVLIASEKKLDLTDNGVTVSKTELAMIESDVYQSVPTEMKQQIFSDEANYYLHTIPYWLAGKQMMCAPLNGGSATVTKAGKLYLISRKTNNANTDYEKVMDLDFEPWGGNGYGGGNFASNGFALYVKDVELGEKVTWSRWGVPLFYSDRQLSKEPINGITDIEVVRMPEKTTYKLGEEFDTTGLVVRATDFEGNKVILESEDYTVAPAIFSSDVPAVSVIVNNMNCLIPVTVTDASGNEITDHTEYSMKGFTTQKAPVLTGSISRSTAEEAILTIQKEEEDGATAFIVYLMNLNEADRDVESLKRIAECTDYPVMAIAYGNYGNLETRLEVMRNAVRAGFAAVDIPADTSSVSNDATKTSQSGTIYASASPKEWSLDSDVIAQQKEFMAELREINPDVEILMSAHVGVSLTQKQGIAMATEMKERGADIAKIVLGSDSNHLDVLNTNMILKEQLGIPFYYNCTGAASKPYRSASTLMGTQIIFCCAEYHKLNTSFYEYVKDLRTFYNTVPELYREVDTAPRVDVTGLAEIDLSTAYAYANNIGGVGDSAHAAFDGDTSTRWCASGPDKFPSSLMVDLQDIKEIAEIRINFEQPSEWVYTLLVSVDGVNWSEYGSNPENTIQQKYTNQKDAMARYVRIDITRAGLGSNGGQCWASIWELEVLEKGTQQNVAIHCPCATTSCNAVSASAAAAFDNNVFTRYCASDASMPQTLMVDLGKETNVRAIYLLFEQYSGFEYVLETSVDGIEWNEYVQRSGDIVFEVLHRGEQNARYVRISITGSTEGAWASVREMKIYE